MAGPSNPTKNANEPHTVSQTASNVADRAKEMASNLGDKAKEATNTMANKAEGATSYVGHKAEDAAAYVSGKADDATAAVGGGLRSLGSTLRQKAPNEGMMGDASSAVANTLERTGRHLQEEGFRGIIDDVTNAIRRNPIPALFVGIGVGFLLARALTPRR
jgi:hypothetical protein